MYNNIVIIVGHVTPLHGQIWPLHRMIERTATVALPTAASGGSISGDLVTSAALDAFSTVYEFPLTRFKNRQTDRQTNKHTDMTDCYTSLYELRPREVIIMAL